VPPTATPSPTAASQQYSFAAQADAYVHSALPDRNFGRTSQLAAWDQPEINSYLRFDVQGTSGAIGSATLRLFALSSSSDGIEVHGVASNGWSETGITYNNAPAMGGVVGSSGGYGAGQWLEIDVTSLVNGNGPVSLAFTAAGSQYQALMAREVPTFAPELVVTTP
jgi:hypothetical protein